MVKSCRKYPTIHPTICKERERASERCARSPRGVCAHPREQDEQLEGSFAKELSYEILQDPRHTRRAERETSERRPGLKEGRHRRCGARRLPSANERQPCHSTRDLPPWITYGPSTSFVTMATGFREVRRALGVDSEAGPETALEVFASFLHYDWSTLRQLTFCSQLREMALSLKGLRSVLGSCEGNRQVVDSVERFLAEAFDACGGLGSDRGVRDVIDELGVLAAHVSSDACVGFVRSPVGPVASWSVCSRVWSMSSEALNCELEAILGSIESSSSLVNTEARVPRLQRLCQALRLDASLASASIARIMDEHWAASAARANRRAGAARVLLTTVLAAVGATDEGRGFGMAPPRPDPSARLASIHGSLDVLCRVRPVVSKMHLLRPTPAGIVEVAREVTHLLARIADACEDSSATSRRVHDLWLTVAAHPHWIRGCFRALCTCDPEALRGAVGAPAPEDDIVEPAHGALRLISWHAYPALNDGRRRQNLASALVALRCWSEQALGELSSCEAFANAALERAQGADGEAEATRRCLVQFMLTQAIHRSAAEGECRAASSSPLGAFTLAAIDVQRSSTSDAADCMVAEMALLQFLWELAQDLRAGRCESSPALVGTMGDQLDRLLERMRELSDGDSAAGAMFDASDADRSRLLIRSAIGLD